MIKNDIKKLKEAQKQLKQVLERKTTELNASKETIDKPCRDIGEAKRMNQIAKTETAERLTQLETALRQKAIEVEEARYQTPPLSECLVWGGETHSYNQEDLHG